MAYDNIKLKSSQQYNDNFQNGNAHKLWTLTDDGKSAPVPPSYVTTFGKDNATRAQDHVHKIGVGLAAMFVLGEMAGGGVIAMPQAMMEAGWAGVAVIILGAVVSGYTGFQLGWCWAILQENWPQYRSQTRKPYPEIGYRAGSYGGEMCGRLMKYFVQFCVNFTVFGTSVAFLVLSAQNISQLILSWFDFELNYCWMLLIVAAFLWPFTFLGTPKDFWPVAVGAIAATTTAVIFVVVGTIIDAPKCQHKISYPAPTFVSFISAYGTIAFAYGGHSAFPTIQHDMKKPSLFPKSVLYGYIVVFLLYFPMPLFAYIVYGDNVQSPIYNSLSTGWIQDLCTVLITGHVMFAFFIFINPISQDLEDIIGIPTYFTWKRMCTRTFMLGVILFVALSVPDFGILLNLIGGTTIAAMTFVCPGPFYLLLRKATAQNRYVTVKDAKGNVINQPVATKMSVFDHNSIYGSNIAWWEWLVNGAVVILGTFGGAATIYAVIAQLSYMSPPCYTVGMNGGASSSNSSAPLLCWMDGYNDTVNGFVNHN